MTAAALLAHAISIGYGIGASLACLACFQAAGVAVLPRRWRESPGGSATLAVVGAALYTLACWIGIFVGVPITWTAIGFAAGAVGLGGLRLALRAALRRGTAAVAARRRQRALMAAAGARVWWVVSFVLLYALAYVFTMPSVDGEFLAPAWTGNVDLMTYALYTRHLLHLGTSNLDGFLYLNFVYLQTPGLFALLGGLAQLFGQDPLSATMPAMFACSALVGVVAADIARRVFRLPRPVALAIAAALISGPFYRYIAGAYFLSTVMALPVLLCLLKWTVSGRVDRALAPTTIVRFGSAYLLLLLIYPFLLLMGVVAQGAAIGLMALERSRAGAGAWREALRRATRTTAAILVPLVPLAFLIRQPADPNRFADAPLMSRLEWTVDTARSLSAKGVAGWPLDLISPLAVFGWPDTIRGKFHIVDPGLQVWALGAFGGIALALAFAYFGRLRMQTTLAQRTWVGLAGGSLLLYCAYYLQAGASYQQWKFASYTALPLSFIVMAAAFHLWLLASAQTGSMTNAVARFPGLALAAPRLLRGLPLVAALGLVAGNLVVHARQDPELMRIPAHYRNLAIVNALPFRDLTVQMADDAYGLASRLAVYFMQDKRVYVISPYFGPSVPLQLGSVTREHPLLIQDYGCEGVGHSDTFTVPQIGCLLYAPPSLALGESYPFNRSFLFVDFEGLGPREAEGRWNRGDRARLALLADERRVRLDGELCVSLRVSHRGEGPGRQRVLLTWGDGRRGEATLDRGGWLSLPVRAADWVGSGHRTLPVSLEMPEANERTVLFEDVSVGAAPLGRIVRAVEAGRGDRSASERASRGRKRADAHAIAFNDGEDP